MDQRLVDLELQQCRAGRSRAPGDAAAVENHDTLARAKNRVGDQRPAHPRPDDRDIDVEIFVSGWWAIRTLPRLSQTGVPVRRLR